MIEWLFLAVPWGCLQFVIVVFPDHTHLLFLMSGLLCLCCVATVKSLPVLGFNVVTITIVRIYTWQSFIALTFPIGITQIPHLRSSLDQHSYLVNNYCFHYVFILVLDLKL